MVVRLVVETLCEQILPSVVLDLLLVRQIPVARIEALG